MEVMIERRCVVVGVDGSPNSLAALRRASGSYFPPPVRMVEIPKPQGGTRTLGVPTVLIRI